MQNEERDAEMINEQEDEAMQENQVDMLEEDEMLADDMVEADDDYMPGEEGEEAEDENYMPDEEGEEGEEAEDEDYMPDEEGEEGIPEEEDFGRPSPRREFFEGRHIDNVLAINEIISNQQDPRASLIIESIINNRCFQGDNGAHSVLRVLNPLEIYLSGYGRNWGEHHVCILLTMLKGCQNGDMNEKDFSEKVLALLTKMCFELNISNSIVVAAVLKCFFDFQGDFSTLFTGDLLKENSAFQLPASILSSFMKEDLHMSSAESIKNVPLFYFLHHANERKLTFGEGDDVRFIDQLFFDLCGASVAEVIGYLEDHRILLTLLRYGASLFPPYQTIDEDAGSLGAKMLRDILTEMVHWLLESKSVADEVGRESRNLKLQFDVYNLSMVVNVILRTMPIARIAPIDDFYESAQESKLDMNAIVTICDVTGLVPKLKSRYKTPAELKHLSRCAIRKRLYDNWKLPQGIQKLFLPADLRNYIDLLED